MFEVGGHLPRLPLVVSQLMHLPPASPVCSIAHEKINFSEQYIQASQRIALHGTEFQSNSNI